MSILIKDMDMPKSCYRCPMANDDFYLCGATEKYLENDSEERRPDWCPLIEIPTPHGRLIDATFEENHYGSMLLNPTPDVTVEDRKKAKAIIDALQMARTVIEAEGEKDGR